MASGNIKYPFGAASVQAISGTGAQAAVIDDVFTLINVSSMTGAVTLNLTFETGLQTGAQVIIHVVQSTTGRNVTLGTGFADSAPDLTGVASDEDILALVYNGTSLVPLTAAWNKIVDAA